MEFIINLFYTYTVTHTGIINIYMSIRFIQIGSPVKEEIS